MKFLQLFKYLVISLLLLAASIGESHEMGESYDENLACTKPDNVVSISLDDFHISLCSATKKECLKQCKTQLRGACEDLCRYYKNECMNVNAVNDLKVQCETHIANEKLRISKELKEHNLEGFLQNLNKVNSILDTNIQLAQKRACPIIVTNCLIEESEILSSTNDFSCRRHQQFCRKSCWGLQDSDDRTCIRKCSHHGIMSYGC